jgi:hypothetical protein
MNIIVNYYKNRLVIDNVPVGDKKKVRCLWNIIREDYADWVAEVRLKEFGQGMPLVELLKWKGMSTWWITPLVSKSVGLNDRWMNRLMILYLCKHYTNDLELKTDDKIVITAINNNFENQNIEILKSEVNNFGSYVKYQWVGVANLLRYILSILQCFERWLVLRSMAKKQTSQNLSLNSSIWFQSQYPANWIKTENGVWQDRHLADAPLEDVKYKKCSNYLMYLQFYGKDNNVGFFQLWKNVRSIEDKTNRKVTFPEAHLRISDFIDAYLSTLVEWIKLRNWKKLSQFRDLFHLNGMDVSDILISEWESGYWGLIQYCKLRGLATKRFFNVLSHQPTIVNYAEFYIETRADYHLRSLTDYGALYYAVQHTQSSRNTGETYNRRSEFSQTEPLDPIHFCPAPDYYLAHGEQYANILSEYYPKKQIKVIGSLKIKQYLDHKKHSKASLFNELEISSSKITVLIAASSEDIVDICIMLMKWQPERDINIIFTPHPSSNVKNVKILIKTYLSHLPVLFINTISTPKIMAFVDLIICGFSNISFEAALFGTPSVMLIPLGAFYPREADYRVPEFYDGETFNAWFNSYNWNNKRNQQKAILTQLAFEYYYYPDGKASDRMWKILAK